MCSLGLQDISCISDCMGLLHLDLAKNNISDLKDLGRFRTLHVQCINMYSQIRVPQADTVQSVRGILWPFEWYIVLAVGIV